jgi:DNA topoisomerase I
MIKNLVLAETEAKVYSLQKIFGAEYTVICIKPVLEFSQFNETPTKFTLYDSILISPSDEETLLSKLQGVKYIYLAFEPTPFGEAQSLAIKARYKASKRVYKRLWCAKLDESTVKNALISNRKFERKLASHFLTDQYLHHLIYKRLSGQAVKTETNIKLKSWIDIFILNLISQNKETNNNSKNETIGHFKIKDKIINAQLVSVNDEEIDVSDVHFFKALAIELNQQKFKVSTVTNEVHTIDAPQCFNLAKLVHAAAYQHDMSCAQIVDQVNILYQGNNGINNLLPLVSFPFVNSQFIKDSERNIVRHKILHDYGVDYLGNKTAPEMDAIENFEAIRPTVYDASKKIKVLPKKLFQLYELIYNRTIASEMIDAKTKRAVVEISSDNDRYKFKAIGEEYEKRGFTVVYKNGKLTPGIGITINKNSELSLVRVSQQKNSNKRPQFLTKILDKLLTVGFENSLEPVRAICRLETEGLLKYANGPYSLTSFGRSILKSFQKNNPELFNDVFVTHLINLSQNIYLGKISPEQCFIEANKLSKYQESINRTKKSLAEFNERDKVCPECSEKMIVRSGKFGKFLACSSYPKCNFTSSISIGVNCPQLGCSGDVIERKTKNNKTFFGCNRYPSCKFASWEKPINIVCPQCKNLYLVIRGFDYHCPACSFKIVKKEFAA